MWIVCNNIFVGNSVGGYVFSSRHSPPPAPDWRQSRPYIDLHLLITSWSPLLRGGGGGGGAEFIPLTV